MSTTKELIQWIDEELGKAESWIANGDGCREENLKYKDLMTEIKKYLEEDYWYILSDGTVCCRYCLSIIGENWDDFVRDGQNYFGVEDD